MYPSVHKGFSRVFRALKANGIILESHPQLPCVTRMIVGRRLHTSWWAHPQANLIYNVLNRLCHHKDVLTVKLVSGKVTLVHRKLWAAVFTVATSREPWQMKGLSRTARKLLTQVMKVGMLETNHLPAYEKRSRLIAKAAKELERRLLLYGEAHHTKSGAHAKRLETWGHWARRARLARARVKPEQAKTQLKDALVRLARSPKTKARLPWEQAS